MRPRILRAVELPLSDEFPGVRRQSSKPLDAAEHFSLIAQAERMLEHRTGVGASKYRDLPEPEFRAWVQERLRKREIEPSLRIATLEMQSGEKQDVLIYRRQSCEKSSWVQTRRTSDLGGYVFAVDPAAEKIIQPPDVPAFGLSTYDILTLDGAPYFVSSDFLSLNPQ